jgi:hypothetical protein
MSETEDSDTTIIDDNETKINMDKLKAELISLCQKNEKNNKRIRSIVEMLSSTSTPLSSASTSTIYGQWKLIYATTDATRSSPFFAAFRKALENNNNNNYADNHDNNNRDSSSSSSSSSKVDRIYAITDSIPEPWKTIGTATQELDATQKRFISRVVVQTLGGKASSIMTTRARILPASPITTDPSSATTPTFETPTIRLQIETTKPEQSTILQTLSKITMLPLDSMAPAFPSGRVLEQWSPGSSIVPMSTLYCDDAIRISKYDWQDRPDDFYIYQRTRFPEYDVL